MPNITSKEKRDRLLFIIKVLRQHEVLRNFLKQKDPKEVRLALEKLGPTFIKAGQLLSTRPDLISPAFIKEFRKLQDNVQIDPFTTVKKTLEAEYNCPLTDIFLQFDERPFASGSIGQTHHALLHDHTPVVVKVQHPNVSELVETDLSLFKEALRILKFVPDLSVIDPKEIFTEIQTSLLTEIDTQIELKNGLEFYRLNNNDGIIRVPKVYPKYSASKILVNQAMPGQSIKKLTATKATKADKPLRTILAKTLVKNFIKQVFVDNYFHADPHPGNILFYQLQLDDPEYNELQPTHQFKKQLKNTSIEATSATTLPPYRLVYLDFGMMGRLTKNLADGIAQIVIALNTKDTRQIGKAVLAVCNRTGPVDEEDFYNELGVFLTPYLNLGLGQIDLASLLFSIVNLCRQNNLQLKSEVTLLIKAFASLEGIVATLDPELSLMEVARPFAREYFKKQFNVKKSLEELGFELYQASKIAPKIPLKFEQLLDVLTQGQGKIAFKLKDQDKLLDRLEKIVNRVILAIILAALIMSSSLLVQGSAAHSASYNIGVLGYLLAAIVVIILIISELHRHFKK